MYRTQNVYQCQNDSKWWNRSQIIISKETFYNSPGCMIPFRRCHPIRIVRVCFNSSRHSPPHKQNSINRMGFEKGGGASKRFSSLATIIGHFQIITQNDRGNQHRWPPETINLIQAQHRAHHLPPPPTINPSKHVWLNLFKQILCLGFC